MLPSTPVPEEPHPYLFPAGDWYANDFAPNTPGLFCAGRASKAFLRKSGGGVAFDNVDEYARFAKAVSASRLFFGMDDMVSKLGLPQGVNSDQTCAIRIEVEAPLYYLRADWAPDKCLVRFLSPANPPSDEHLRDFRLKWLQQDGPAGVAHLTADQNTVTAEITSAADHIDASLLWHGAALFLLPLSRPREVPVADQIPSSIEELDDAFLDEELDYSQWETTQRKLRLSTKKQLNRDESLYKIISRDIDDAIWCLKNGRHKIATILCGGIIEAVLLARLGRKTPQDIADAYRRKFPKGNNTALDKMRLKELVGVAEQLNCLSHHSLFDSVRDWRNLVHPAAEVREGSVNATHANIAVSAAIMLLLGQD